VPRKVSSQQESLEDRENVHDAFSAIAIAVQVVATLMVSLPNFNGSVGDGIASRVEALSRKGQRHAGISARAARR
jgi:hypothetical protein